MSVNTELERRLAAVRKRIEQACAAAGRSPARVALLAVSKTRSPAEIRAMHALGIAAFGENYAAEAVDKQAELAALGLTWHFIGPLQSNKTRLVATHFDWVQSVDRDKLVRRLDAQRPPERPPLNVLIQVNIDREPQKAGCDPEAVEALAESILARPRLALRGLMVIPAAGRDPAAAFARAQALYRHLAERVPSVDTLSMGMSDDLEVAIACGSTMVRIGTALFGPRPAAR